MGVSDAARNHYATSPDPGKTIKAAVSSLLYNSINFANEHTRRHGWPNSKEVTRNVPRAVFRLISHSPDARNNIDNCLKIIALVSVVKCFKGQWGFQKCAQLFWPQIERQLSFQWERYAHRGKDKEVSKSGVSAPSGTNTRPFERPHRETRGNWFQLYSWSNAWPGWRVTQWWTCPLKLGNHLEDMATCEWPITLDEYCTTITLFHTSKHLEVIQCSYCVSDDLFVGAGPHLLKSLEISALYGLHWQSWTVTLWNVSGVQMT